MSGPSEEDLDKIREENKKLRAKIAAAESTRATREAEASRQLEYTQLQAENVRLQAELTNAEALAKVGSVKEGAEHVLAQSKEELARATAAAKAPTAAEVRTNPEGEADQNGGNS